MDYIQYKIPQDALHNDEELVEMPFENTISYRGGNSTTTDEEVYRSRCLFPNPGLPSVPKKYRIYLGIF